MKKNTKGALHPAQKFVVERIHRSKIANASYNPRQIDDHARKKLLANIKKKGLLDTLVWNKRTGNLVSGHQRLSILDALSKTGADYSLDVAVVDLSEKDEKEQNIFFNNPSAQGTYEVDALGSLIVDEEVDYKAAGFDDMDLQVMFEDTRFDVTMFDRDGAPKEVQDDLEHLEEIQRMKRERKEHRDRDQKENDPEFYAVVVFPDREAQSTFMERVGKDRSDRYVDGVRVMTSLDAARPPMRKSKDGEFVEMKFWVATDQRQVIEDELVRIGSLMHGKKNIRGRALEAMAVISSQTETENITGEEPEGEPTFKTKRKRRT